mmetsp:Transcript_41004/g.102431  ORF Transcript_41004/g.102431 Transcript_41004/m.102431 type:complete len:296 (-) Transcript_41004:213-1100(-)
MLMVKAVYVEGSRSEGRLILEGHVEQRQRRSEQGPQNGHPHSRPPAIRSLGIVGSLCGSVYGLQPHVSDKLVDDDVFCLLFLRLSLCCILALFLGSHPSEEGEKGSPTSLLLFCLFFGGRLLHCVPALGRSLQCCVFFFAVLIVLSLLACFRLCLLSPDAALSFWSSCCMGEIQLGLRLLRHFLCFFFLPQSFHKLLICFKFDFLVNIPTLVFLWGDLHQEQQDVGGRECEPQPQQKHGFLRSVVVLHLFLLRLFRLSFLLLGPSCWLLSGLLFLTGQIDDHVAEVTAAGSVIRG